MGYPDWLLPFIETADAAKDVLRSLLWTYMLKSIAGCSALYEGFMDLFDLDGYLPTMSFVDTANGVVGKIVPTLFALALVFAGFLLILNNQRAKKELASGVIVSVLLIVLTPYTIGTMGKITDLVTDGMTNMFVSAEAEGLADKGVYSPKDEDGADMLDVLLQSGTVDILASKQNGKVSYLVAEPDVIDINEKIGGYFGHADLFSVTKDGKPLKADNWILPEMTNQGLYRYQVDFFQVALIATVLVISIILAGVRAAATIYEIIFNQIIAPIVFATDLMQTGRAKAFMQRIIGTYLSLMVIIFSLLMYVRLSAWVLDYVKNWWAVFFLLVGFTMAMFNGPDSLIKLIGIDVGTRSGAAPFVSTAAVVSQAISMTSMVAARGGSGGEKAAMAADSANGTRSAPEVGLVHEGSAPSGSPREPSQTNTHTVTRENRSSQSFAPSSAAPERSPSGAGAPTSFGPTESAAASASATNAGRVAAEEAAGSLHTADQTAAAIPHDEYAPAPVSSPFSAPAGSGPSAPPTPYMAPPSLDFLPPSYSHTAAPSQSRPPEALNNVPPMPPPPPPQGGRRL